MIRMDSITYATTARSRAAGLRLFTGLVRVVGSGQMSDSRGPAEQLSARKLNVRRRGPAPSQLKRADELVDSPACPCRTHSPRRVFTTVAPGRHRPCPPHCRFEGAPAEAQGRRGGRTPPATAGDRPAAKRRAGDVPRRRGVGGAGELQRAAVGVQQRSRPRLVVHADRRAAQHAEGTCLDAAGYDGAPGANVDVFRCESLDDQRWTLVARGNNTFELRNNKRGLCLDVKGRNGARGDDVLLWACDGGPDQLWSFEPYAPPPPPPPRPDVPAAAAAGPAHGPRRPTGTPRIRRRPCRRCRFRRRPRLPRRPRARRVAPGRWTTTRSARC